MWDYHPIFDKRPAGAYEDKVRDDDVNLMRLREVESESERASEQASEIERACTKERTIESSREYEGKQERKLK